MDPSLQSPKNRQPERLPVCEIRIAWDGGELVTDPNALILMAYQGGYPVGLPFSERPSALSGAPSYLYKSDNLEIPLTLGELDRMNRRALASGEFKALMQRYGRFHEIQGDFYFFENGVSAQPKPRGSGLAITQERLAALQERHALESILPPGRAASKASP